MEQLVSVIDMLNQIENDFSVPKNVRSRIKETIVILNEKEKAFEVRMIKAIEELELVADDSNVPSFTRTQVWNIVSLLESFK